MKYLFLILIFVLPFCSFSQNEGYVNKKQDKRVEQLIQRQKDIHAADATIDGFRIQIFMESGNDAVELANAAIEEFKEKYPDMPIYLVFGQPYYRLRVGDFRTRLEAEKVFQTLSKDYKKAFVVVSHDRMFLDNIAQIVYEIENGKTHKYIGNYTQFCENKKLLRAQQQKQYEAQQKEIAHLSDLADRFRYKATKAAMAQSKLKQIERMDVIDSPEKQDLRTFKADFEPDDLGVKDMLTVKDLCVGYNKPITTVSLEVLQGERVGIIGGNGLGKSTFIETIMGNIPKISGEFRFAHRAKIGYFSQQMAAYSSDKTVLDDFMDEYPELTVNECRSALGAFLFSGEEVFKTVNMLSGGEKVRLALCKIFKAKPNFLILDEPTNHMDIIGKEALEDMLSVYNGTVLFVSHDRYFVKKIATNILNFNEGGTEFYRFGYEDFLNFKSKETVIESTTVQKASSSKKSFTTPLKEKSRLEKAVTKCEDKISDLEVKIEEINTQLSLEDVISDYVKLTQLQNELSALENALNEEYLQWEELSEKLNQIG